jgi:hypothetical protein
MYKTIFIPLTNQMKDKKARYYLEGSSGEFVIENYNHAKPLANFFPGIAGKYGIPLWAFYVNRSQCLASFGTRDKDHAILEFFPANKSWQLVSTYGFRTFIKIGSGQRQAFYEPFHNGFTNLGFNITNRMRIRFSDLTLEEENLSLGLKIRVDYFTVPHETFAALARLVTIKNTSRLKKDLEVADGLPQIVPYGTSNLFLKKLGRTIEAWMQVENLRNAAPFYKLAVDPTDRPEVVHIQEGNFYLGFLSGKNKPHIIKPIVDPRSLFGVVTDFSCPVNFLAGSFKPPKDEVKTSKMPAAFSYFKLQLKAGEEKTFYCLSGNMRSLKMLNSSLTRIASPDYLKAKRAENRKLIAELQEDIATSSSSREFDLYARQTYLDNILRGGYPLVFRSGSVFYLYSRKHGDLERDYNKFSLQPTYFSQGNGNYRDTNQNRRLDVWFNPEVRDENIVTFFNLIQSDGFNPLVIKGLTFKLKEDSGLKTVLSKLVRQEHIDAILDYVNKPFTPGDVIIFLENHRIKPVCTCDEFLEQLLCCCQKNDEAEHGEGFWSDHWTYNLDLLESYLGVYPEKFRELLFEKRDFVFFDNSEVVRARSEKYLLYQTKPRQLKSVAADAAKRETIHKRLTLAHLVRMHYGQGEIYRTTLIDKLLCILVNKLASLDPFGAGIEMEADRPNWYDALNGLPALFGSSLNETMELKRLVIFIQQALVKFPSKNISLTREIYDFLAGLDALLKEFLKAEAQERDYLYWDKSYRLKEEYRQKTKLGFSGEQAAITSQELSAILERALAKLTIAIKKSEAGNTYSGYFINQVAGYQITKEPFFRPNKFIQKKLPLFLETQVHGLKIAASRQKARAIYRAVKNSPLYDKKLKMYKVTAPLGGMPEEIGRCRNFAPGWLENESVWLHMEYKYLLELLKAGLYEEFYVEFKHLLIPFQPPARYGRSILENSSFLVSSAFADQELQGNGFVARLSGSTAEFLHIWLLMNCGKTPFFLNAKDELNLRLMPLLAGWLFNKTGLYSFNFLSRVQVTYHNPARKNTFGRNAAKISKITFLDKDGQPVELTSETIPCPYAEQVRQRLIKQIDIFLR